MKFELIDQVLQATDEKLVAVKTVTAAEEYLADHFPSFPVLPGVLMLEAAAQAATFLLHRRTDFARAVAVIREARNIRYGHFVAPGQTLTVTAEFLKQTDAGASFKVAGEVAGTQAFAGRLELAYFDLAQKNLADSSTDEALKAHARRRWARLGRDFAAASL
ncbi:MAG: 3-hydroxyacyl-ACP dehydratase FabZ family protein [Phycisphaerae bacterium]